MTQVAWADGSAHVRGSTNPARAGNLPGASIMIKRATLTLVRNSLISLAISVLAPVAWAGPPPDDTTASAATGSTNEAGSGTPSSLSGVNVPMQIPARPPRPRLLDLRPPDIRAVMSAEQLTAALPNPDETEVVGPETVQVRGSTPPPYVPSGFAALYWAATHPSQAWRILAPAQ